MFTNYYPTDLPAAGIAKRGDVVAHPVRSVDVSACDDCSGDREKEFFG